MEHAFPLPETEAHKLDGVINELPPSHNAALHNFFDFIRANPWATIGVVIGVGLLLGLAAGKRT